MVSTHTPKEGEPPGFERRSDGRVSANGSDDSTARFEVTCKLPWTRLPVFYDDRHKQRCMEPRELDRRRVLQLSGLSGAVALAGCLGGDGDDAANGNDTNGNDTNDNDTTGNYTDGSDNGTQNTTTENGGEQDEDGQNGNENGEDQNGQDDTQSGFEEGDLGTIGEIPAYSGYVRPDEEDETFAIYLDVQALQEHESLISNNEETQEDEPLISQDLLIETPAIGLFIFGFLSLELATTGLGELATISSTADFESTVTEVYLVNDTLVLSGDIDRAEISETLQTVREGTFQQPFTKVDTVSGFALYQPESASDTEPETYAVGEDTIIRGDTRVGVERMIEAVNGAVSSTAETYDDFAWALSAAGHGDVVLGGYNSEGFNTGSDENQTTEGPLSDIEAPVPGMVSSMTFESDGVAAETAFVFQETPDSEVRSRIHAALGGQADEVTYTYDGRYMLLTGSYDLSLFTT